MNTEDMQQHFEPDGSPRRLDSGTFVAVPYLAAGFAKSPHALALASGSDSTVRIPETMDIIIIGPHTGRRFILRCPNPTDWQELNEVAAELMQQSLLLRPNTKLSGPQGPL
jgi:hypothetical protein